MLHLYCKFAALKKRSDGRYKATYTHKGKKHYFYGATRDEANAKREAYIDALKKAPNMDGSITFSEWLDEYLIDAKTRVSRATYSSYESLVRIHLKPGLGDYPLIGLQPHMIRDFLYRKLEDGSSTRSVEYMYVILKAALTLAVNDGLLYRNPAAGVRKPKVQKTPAAVLTLEQLKKLLNAIDDDPEYFRLIYITASTGLRREEVLALRIKDIDTRRHTLSVLQTLHYDSRQTYITKTTKTASSRRTIALDDITYGYVQEQMQVIEDQRQLLHEPDPITTLSASLTQELRSELNSLKERYEEQYQKGLSDLKADGNWNRLTPEQKNELLSAESLDGTAQPVFALQSTTDILATLDKTSCSVLKDRIAALPARFEKVAREAAARLEPKTQFISISHRTLRSEEDIDAWLREVEAQLKAALPNGPVVAR